MGFPISPPMQLQFFFVFMLAESPASIAYGYGIWSIGRLYISNLISAHHKPPRAAPRPLHPLLTATAACPPW